MVELTKINDRNNIQPFIIMEGKLITDFDKVYNIYFDSIIINRENVVSAFDCIFKIFNLFNLKYLTASNNFWMFIQLFDYSKKSKNNSLIQHMFVCFFLNQISHYKIKYKHKFLCFS